MPVDYFSRRLKRESSITTMRVINPFLVRSNSRELMILPLISFHFSSVSLYDISPSNNSISFSNLMTEWLRLHLLRKDRLWFKGRNRLQAQHGDRRRHRPISKGPKSWIMGFDGTHPRLLREGQSRHFQWPGSVHRLTGLPSQPHLRRVWVPAWMVLRLRWGYVHWTPQGMQPEHLLRWSVACLRRSSLSTNGHDWWV